MGLWVFISHKFKIIQMKINQRQSTLTSRGPIVTIIWHESLCDWHSFNLPESKQCRNDRKKFKWKSMVTWDFNLCLARRDQTLVYFLWCHVNHRGVLNDMSGTAGAWACSFPFSHCALMTLFVLSHSAITVSYASCACPKDENAGEKLTYTPAGECVYAMFAGYAFFLFIKDISANSSLQGSPHLERNVDTRFLLQYCWSRGGSVPLAHVKASEHCVAEKTKATAIHVSCWKAEVDRSHAIQHPCSGSCRKSSIVACNTVLSTQLPFFQAKSCTFFLIVMKIKAFFFCFLRAAPAAYGSSQTRGQIRATAADHSHSYSNAGSLTHWVRPAIKPTSSGILLGFLSTEPHGELLNLFFSLMATHTTYGSSQAREWIWATAAVTTVLQPNALSQG